MDRESLPWILGERLVVACGSPTSKVRINVLRGSPEIGARVVQIRHSPSLAGGTGTKPVDGLTFGEKTAEAYKLQDRKKARNMKDVVMIHGYSINAGLVGGFRSTGRAVPERRW